MKKIGIICLAVLVLAVVTLMRFSYFRRSDSSESNNLSYFDRNTTVGEVINNSSFDGFGKLIFPIDITIPSTTTLSDLEDYYVCYNYMNADKTVEIVNYMKEEVEGGRQIFYPIYSEEEMRENPDKRNTGLFFFRGNPDSKFAIVNAGWCSVQPITEITVEDYDKAFNLDVRAVVDLTTRALPMIMETKGNIINLSSVGATHPAANLSMYTGAKAAIENFTRVWALELALKGVELMRLLQEQ